MRHIMPTLFFDSGTASRSIYWLAPEQPIPGNGLQAEATYSLQITLYDSFDWRLYRADTVLFEWYSNQLQGTVLIHSGAVYSTTSDRHDLVLHDQIASILQPRADLAQADLALNLQYYTLRDEQYKILARCHTLTTANQGLLFIDVLRGYQTDCADFIQSLEALPHCYTWPNCLYELAQVKAGSYSNKPNYTILPTEPAVNAINRVLSWLVNIMQCNEAGVKQNLDSEFLHDFRVAVRRTRSLLTYYANFFPANALTRFQQDFKWLGQITGPVRDLDVYLLAIPKFEQRLPELLKNTLKPLQKLLEQQHQKAHSVLVKVLESERYRDLISAWQEMLTQIPATSQTIPISEYGGQALWKNYRKLYKKGSAINEDSPPEALHDLRKDGKRLRYLIDTLSGAYPPETVDALLPVLKKLQSVLGDYQDCSVQIEHLSHYARQLHADPKVRLETLLALGALIAQLDQKQNQLRARFAAEFGQFADKSIREQVRGFMINPR